MKAKKLFVLIGSLSLLGGVVSCTSNKSSSGPNYAKPEELVLLQTLFEDMNEGYNFTLESTNERNAHRVLNVYNPYCFYYSYRYSSAMDDYGMFYVEGQGTQDFHIENENVIIDFHEGPGKVNLVENFAYSHTGDIEFSRVPMSELLSTNWKHFFKANDSTFYTSDRHVNRIFSYFSNQMMINAAYEYGGEEYYIDFSKSKTTITINDDGDANIIFEPFYKDTVPFEPEASYLNIYDVGRTENEIISDYLAHPNPISKKSGYEFNTGDYEATFGDVSIPFSSKFSGYISKYEDYRNAAISVYDMSYEDGVLEDVRNNLSENWEYDADESDFLTKKMQHPVYSYHSLSTITQQMEDQTVENVVDVYYSVALVPVNSDPVERTLRPRGFFVGEIYRKLGEEAITEFDDIKTYLENNSNMDYLPNIERLRPYNCVLRDYTENEAIQQGFISQGYYLFNYLVLRIEGTSSGAAINLAKNFRDDLNKLSCYESVTLDNETYDLNALPSIEFFQEAVEPLMQIIGSPIRNSEDIITGYQLILIAYSFID